VQQRGSNLSQHTIPFTTVAVCSSKLANDNSSPDAGRPTPLQERSMGERRSTLCAEDAKALTLLMGAAADEFTVALDRCGWMIVPQPQFGPRRWFMNRPSNACPEWADNDVPEKPPAPRPRLRLIDGGKNEAPVD
jgi:hypothetical protein